MNKQSIHVIKSICMTVMIVVGYVSAKFLVRDVDVLNTKFPVLYDIIGLDIGRILAEFIEKHFDISSLAFFTMMSLYLKAMLGLALISIICYPAYILVQLWKINDGSLLLEKTKDVLTFYVAGITLYYIQTQVNLTQQGLNIFINGHHHLEDLIIFKILFTIPFTIFLFSTLVSVYRALINIPKWIIDKQIKYLES